VLPALAAIPLGPGLPQGLKPPTRKLGRAGLGACLFGVAPDGGCPFHPHRTRCQIKRDSSLWPCSSCRHAGGLPRTLLFGARTFLHALRRSGCLAGSRVNFTPPPVVDSSHVQA